MSHSASQALLMDGPCKGKRCPVQPGQTVLEVVEDFDYDQEKAKKFHLYEYEKPVTDEPGVAVFVHRQSHMESTVDQ
jgi:hypothetical protein